MEPKIFVTRKGKIFEGVSEAIIQDRLLQTMFEATSFLERKIKEFIRSLPNRRGRGVGGEQGGYISTIHGEVIGKGTPIIKGIVGHQSKYGDVVEKGRTAGKAWPPEGSLIKWVQVKMGVLGHEAKRLEFVIRRKIGRKGFEGIESFQTVLNREWPQLQGIFDHCGFEIARELSE